MVTREDLSKDVFLDVCKTIPLFKDPTNTKYPDYSHKVLPAYIQEIQAYPASLTSPKALVQKLEIDFSRPLMTGAIWVFEHMALETYCNTIWDYLVEGLQQNDVHGPCSPRKPLDLFVVHICG